MARLVTQLNRRWSERVGGYMANMDDNLDKSGDEIMLRRDFFLSKLSILSRYIFCLHLQKNRWIFARLPQFLAYLPRNKITFGKCGNVFQLNSTWNRCLLFRIVVLFHSFRADCASEIEFSLSQIPAATHQNLILSSEPQATHSTSYAIQWLITLQQISSE